MGFLPFFPCFPLLQVRILAGYCYSETHLYSLLNKCLSKSGNMVVYFQPNDVEEAAKEYSGDKVDSNHCLLESILSHRNRDTPSWF